MFGLTRAEKLRKNLDKNGINTVGEVTHIDDTPADQFFFAQFGEQWEKKPPAIPAGRCRQDSVPDRG